MNLFSNFELLRFKIRCKILNFQTRTKFGPTPRKESTVSVSLSLCQVAYILCTKKTSSHKKRDSGLTFSAGQKPDSSSIVVVPPFIFVQSLTPPFYPPTVLGNSVMPRCDGGRGEGRGEKKGNFRAHEWNSRTEKEGIFAWWWLTNFPLLFYLRTAYLAWWKKEKIKRLFFSSFLRRCGKITDRSAPFFHFLLLFSQAINWWQVAPSSPPWWEEIPSWMESLFFVFGKALCVDRCLFLLTTLYPYWILKSKTDASCLANQKISFSFFFFFETLSFLFISSKLPLTFCQKNLFLNSTLFLFKWSCCC